MTLSVDQAIRAQALALAISQKSDAGAPSIGLADQYADFITDGLPKQDAANEPEPAKRGRKARGEVDGVAVKPAAAPVEQTTPAPAQTAAPVATATSTITPASPVQVGTMEAMRTAVLEYRKLTNDATALQLLKNVGAENFGQVSPAQFQEVTNAAVAAIKAVAPPKPALVVEDPFALPGDAPAAPTVTLQDVQKAMKNRQKEVGDIALMGLLKDLGATAPGPGGAPVVSIKALPEAKFAEAIAKLNALPKTK